MSEAQSDLPDIRQVRTPSTPEVPEAKVTIFIEIGDKIKKIEIPHARYLDIENRYIGPYTNTIKFSLSLEPQYDIDRNCYLTEEIRTVLANELLRVDVWPVGESAGQ